MLLHTFRFRMSMKYSRRVSKRAVIYARVSLDHSGEGRSVDRQIEQCRALAGARGWDVVAVEADNSISAWSGKERPAWNRVQDLIRDGQVDVLVAWHIDRMTRSMLDLEGLILLAEANGVGVATVTGDIDLTNDMGRMIARILAAVARAEVERKAARQRLANEQRALEGRSWPSGFRPFGYAHDRTQLVGAEAEAIRDGARLALAGATLASIARRWTDAGLPSTKSGKAWTGNGVKQLLVSPRYAGIATYRGREVGQGDWPPILDLETHLALVTLLTHPDRKKGEAPRLARAQTLLSGIARCGVCGSLVKGASDKKGRLKYACSSSRTCVLLPREECDDYVAGLTVGTLAKSNVRAYSARTGARRPHPLAEQRSALLGRLEEAREAYLDGRIGAETFTALEATARRRLADLEEGSEPEERAGLPRAFTEGDVAQAWERAALADRRTVVQVLFEEIQLHPFGGRKPFDVEAQVAYKMQEAPSRSS